MNRVKDVVIMVLLLAVVYLVATRDGTKTVTDDSVTPPTTIAVLPYVNMSGDAENDYLSNLLWDETINSLAKHGDLRVLSRTSLAQFKGSRDEVEEIGDELGVSYVVEAAVIKGDDRVRITAQLIRIKDGAHLWVNTYDSATGATDSVPVAIADSVAREIRNY